ncbi:MAG: hypothetical protein WA090_02120 [Candidatus Nanopelagicaceae bacterium]
MNSLLLLKLLLAPLFVAVISYIQQRWGDGIGGRLIGLPLTTGPFILIIFIQEGGPFAALAAHGVLVGQVALIVFCWVYAISSLKTSWAPALGLGSISCLLVGGILTSFEIPLLVLLPLLAGSWFLVLKFWPSYSNPPRTAATPRWELPARLLVTVAIILLLTGFANVLGPRIAGALSTYPVIISVLGAFSQKRFGPTATVETLHGLTQVLPVSIVIMATLALTM